MESQRTYKSHFGIGPSSVVMVNTKQLNVTFVDLLFFFKPHVASFELLKILLVLCVLWF